MKLPALVFTSCQPPTFSNTIGLSNHPSYNSCQPAFSKTRVTHLPQRRKMPFTTQDNQLTLDAGLAHLKAVYMPARNCSHRTRKEYESHLTDLITFLSTATSPAWRMVTASPVLSSHKANHRDGLWLTLRCLNTFPHGSCSYCLLAAGMTQHRCRPRTLSQPELGAPFGKRLCFLV